jgi:putative membrane protein
MAATFLHLVFSGWNGEPAAPIQLSWGFSVPGSVGAAFDREFKQAMVKDHREDIAKYKKEARSKGPLAEFAQQTVPTLEKHLQHAQALGQRGPTT